MMTSVNAADRACGASREKGGAVSLPVLGGGSHGVKKSKMGARRAAVLIAVHIVIAIHILHWLVYGMTLSPVEPSESMYAINLGKINAGLVFFVLAILSTLVFGRFFCGWGCHIVALQDLCGWMMKKVGVRPRPFRSRLLVWAPVVLAIYMFAWPTIRREVIRPLVGKQLWEDVAPYIGEAGERPEIKAAFLTEHFWETFPPWFVAIPFLLVCGFAVVYFLGAKGFCTYGCPYGGVFGPVDRVAPGRIRVTDACEHCGHCTAVCTSNVRVHEEVRDYGMVVDPGCMKCMDCVSVCPNEALYFGFGKPAALAKGRPARGARFKSRVFDLSLGEEVLYGAVFLALVIGFRGMLDLVPLLMAMGLAAIATFLLWKTFSMARVENVRLHGWQLRLRGRVKAAGLVVAALTVGMVGAGAWGFVVSASVWRGNSLDVRIATPLEAALARGYRASASEKEAAAGALGHLRRASAWGEGGIGWLSSVDHRLRIARLELILERGAEAEKTLLGAIEDAGGAGRKGVAAPVEDALVGLIMNSSGSAAEAETRLRGLLSTHQGLGSTPLALAGLVLSRGERGEVPALIDRGLAARAGDVRNTLYAVDMLIAMERVEAAIVAVRGALAVNKDSALLQERLGLLVVASGELEKGIEELKKAVGMDSRSSSAARHIAAILRGAGRELEATDWEHRANEIDHKGRP